MSDEYERLWDNNVDAAVPLSSAYMQEHPDPKFENGGMVVSMWTGGACSALMHPRV